MPNVLFITKRHYTNKDLVADRFGRLFHIPLHLFKKGYDVGIIAANYRSLSIEKHYLSGVTVLSLPFFNIFKYLIKSFQFINRFKPDIIIASGDSHFGLIGLLLAKYANSLFVFDIYDDYRVFGTNKFPLMKTFFRQVIIRADFVFCSSRILLKLFSFYNRSMEVIPNGVDKKVFRTIPKEKARKILHIDPKDTIIGYVGSIAPNYGVDLLIDAIDSLRNSIPNARLLLAGAKNTKIDTNYPFVDYKGLLPQKKVPILINASDVLIIPYCNSPQIDVSNPCKISEYLACRVPIVSTRVSDMPAFLSSTPDALCLPGDASDMLRAIKWQIENRQLVDLPESLNWESIGNKVIKILDKMINTGRQITI